MSCHSLSVLTRPASLCITAHRSEWRALQAHQWHNLQTRPLSDNGPQRRTNSSVLMQFLSPVVWRCYSGYEWLSVKKVQSMKGRHPCHHQCCFVLYSIRKVRNAIAMSLAELCCMYVTNLCCCQCHLSTLSSLVVMICCKMCLQVRGWLEGAL